MPRRVILAVMPYAPYGDVGPFEALVSPHEHLHCYDCGQQVWFGVTATGAAIYCCRACEVIADVRRVA